MIIQLIQMKVGMVKLILLPGASGFTIPRRFHGGSYFCEIPRRASWDLVLISPPISKVPNQHNGLVGIIMYIYIYIYVFKIGKNIAKLYQYSPFVAFQAFLVVLSPHRWQNQSKSWRNRNQSELPP